GAGEVVGAVVLVVDDLVVLVVTVVVVVVLDPGTLAGSAGSEPVSSSVRSGKPSSSRSMPIRMPDPTGTAVYVSSCPAVFACARSWASVRSGSPVRSLWNDPAPPQPEPVQTQPRSTPARLPLTTASHSPAAAHLVAHERPGRGKRGVARRVDDRRHVGKAEPADLLIEVAEVGDLEVLRLGLEAREAVGAEVALRGIERVAAVAGLHRVGRDGVEERLATLLRGRE